jgi:hypothetical protein
LKTGYRGEWKGDEDTAVTKKKVAQKQVKIWSQLFDIVSLSSRAGDGVP